LLLDEPFSALDKNNKLNLMQELKELHKRWRIPFILVSHDEEEARFLGDIVLTLEQGQSKGITLQAALKTNPLHLGSVALSERVLKKVQ